MLIFFLSLFKLFHTCATKYAIWTNYSLIQKISQTYHYVTANIGSIISIIMLEIMIECNLKPVANKCSIMTSLSLTKIESLFLVPFFEIRGSTSVSRVRVNLSCSHSQSHSVLYLSSLWYIYYKIIIWHDRVSCAFLKCAWISISRFADKNNNSFPTHL